MGSTADPLPRTSGPPASPTSLPAVLSAAADQLIEQAKSGPPDYDTALTILAADALITFACEAAGEADPRSLVELT